MKRSAVAPFIHPSTDGNGRMGRLCQTLILNEWKPLFAYLPVETIARDRQAAYYKKLADADNTGKATAFVEFMLEAIQSPSLKNYRQQSVDRATLEHGAPLSKRQLNAPRERLIQHSTFDFFFFFKILAKMLRKILPRRIVALLHRIKHPGRRNSYLTHVLSMLINPNKARLTRLLLTKRQMLLVFYPFYFPIIFMAFFSKSKKEKMIFITGANSSYYKSLCQFLTSFFKYESKSKIVVYDLGLTEAENQNLHNSFPLAEVRIFDYSKYPDHLNPKKYAKGCYAWKPVIISTILNEFKCNVCWMDAGNIILRPLYLIRIKVKKSGLYSPYSHGNIARWTYSKTLKFLNTSKTSLKKKNLSGGCIAIDYQNKRARELIIKWGECALIKECIAPEGSSLANHRYDQAVLSILAYQFNFNHFMPKEEFYGLKYQQSID